jgi:hypothetical protein
MTEAKTAAERIQSLFDALSAGKTVYICTCTRATKITQKNVKAWEAYGRPILKAAGNSMYMAVGKRYDCIDYCSIRVV